jgi:hypothetical protein
MKTVSLAEHLEAQAREAEHQEGRRRVIEEMRKGKEESVSIIRRSSGLPERRVGRLPGRV